MTRARISTTVDAHLLEAARAGTGGRDSELFDLALSVLVERLDAAREVEVLTRLPYDADPDVVEAAQATEPVDLPYDGAVPADVVDLARRRRAARAAR